MIEKFAGVRGLALSEFLDLNHTSKSMILVSLVIPKFAPSPAANIGEFRNRDTSKSSSNGRDPAPAHSSLVETAKGACGCAPAHYRTPRSG